MDVTCEIEKNRQAEVVLACLGIARRYQGWRYIKTALEWALAGWEPDREVFIRLGVTYRVSAASVKQSVSRALWQARVHRPEELAYMTFTWTARPTGRAGSSAPCVPGCAPLSRYAWATAYFAGVCGNNFLPIAKAVAEVRQMPSIWSETTQIAPRPPLPGDLETDTAVIGGGMAGVLTAWLLKEAGVESVVLEAQRLGSGQTGTPPPRSPVSTG